MHNFPPCLNYVASLPDNTVATK